VKLRDASLDDVLAAHEGVIDTSQALRFLTPSELRWQIASGRWQKPVRGVVVAQSGPLTDRQMLRATVLRAGPRAALAGLTAARLDGFRGFSDKFSFADYPIHLVVPYGYKKRTPLSGLTCVTHYSQKLTDADVHPDRQPRRTRIARSLIDAAAWMPTDRGAMAVLAAGVQQRLVRADDLRRVVDAIGTLHRRRLILATLRDVAGGAQALSELDFTRQVVRAFGLPEPSRQTARRDVRGRRRWIDVLWEEGKLAVEIDGAQHAEDPFQRWDDMERDNELGIAGYRTLRFPAWVVRRHPESVARRILEALSESGCRG
jgi:hypothetical protein